MNGMWDPFWEAVAIWWVFDSSAGRCELDPEASHLLSVTCFNQVSTALKKEKNNHSEGVG